jgi:hypothetical protein
MIPVSDEPDQPAVAMQLTLENSFSSGTSYFLAQATVKRGSCE